MFQLTSFTTASAPPHGVQHFIELVGQPVSAKFQRLDPVWLAAAKREFQLDESIICRSSSQKSSLLHMAQKKDGSWRPRSGYRRLNLKMMEDTDSPPNMILGILLHSWMAAESTASWICARATSMHMIASHFGLALPDGSMLLPAG